MTEPFIQLQDLAIVTTGSQSCPAFRFPLPRAVSTAILGANGSGKIHPAENPARPRAGLGGRIQVASPGAIRPFSATSRNRFNSILSIASPVSKWPSWDSMAGLVPPICSRE